MWPERTSTLTPWDAESDDGGAFYASLPKPRPPSDDEEGKNGGNNGDGDSEGDFDA